MGKGKLVVHSFDLPKTSTKPSVERATGAPIDVQEARRAVKKAMKEHRPQFSPVKEKK